MVRLKDIDDFSRGSQVFSDEGPRACNGRSVSTFVFLQVLLVDGSTKFEMDLRANNHTDGIMQLLCGCEGLERQLSVIWKVDPLSRKRQRTSPRPQSHLQLSSDRQRTITLRMKNLQMRLDWSG